MVTTLVKSKKPVKHHSKFYLNEIENSFTQKKIRQGFTICAKPVVKTIIQDNLSYQDIIPVIKVRNYSIFKVLPTFPLIQTPKYQLSFVSAYNFNGFCVGDSVSSARILEKVKQVLKGTANCNFEELKALLFALCYTNNRGMHYISTHSEILDQQYITCRNCGCIIKLGDYSVSSNRCDSCHNTWIESRYDAYKAKSDELKQLIEREEIKGLAFKNISSSIRLKKDLLKSGSSFTDRYDLYEYFYRKHYKLPQRQYHLKIEKMHTYKRNKHGKRVYCGFEIATKTFSQQLLAYYKELKNQGIEFNVTFIEPTNLYDKDGYNREGYNSNGYDRDGYNRDGYNTDGYDRNNDYDPYYDGNYNPNDDDSNDDSNDDSDDDI